MKLQGFEAVCVLSEQSACWCTSAASVMLTVHGAFSYFSSVPTGPVTVVVPQGSSCLRVALLSDVSEGSTYCRASYQSRDPSEESFFLTVNPSGMTL